MDTDAVLARHPQVALVDELAHTNAPGSRHEKRWQDVQQLLDAGIDVITTVNIQHLESLNDVVAAITGIKQTETVPDEVVRAAEQIELVDMTPQALRRRMAHGHIYPAERIDTALGNYFREGNLTALRELALLWVADRVEEGLDRYRAQHGIKGTWAARDRIVVALTGGPEGKTLLRRGARIAGRVAGRTLIAVHVVRSDATVGTSATEIERQRLLAENLGGSLQLIVGDDIAATVLEFARSVNATQIIVGAPRHGRLAQLFRPSTANAIVADSGDIDVHVVTHPKAARTRSARAQTGPRSPAAGGLDRRGRHSLRTGGRTAALAGRAGAEHRAADLPARRHRQRPDRRRRPRRGRRGDRRAAGQLPLHPAHRLVDHHRNPSNVFALVGVHRGRGHRRLRRRPQRHPRPASHPGQGRGPTRRRRRDQRGQLPQPRARRPATGPDRLRHDLGRAAGQGPHRAEHLPAHRRRRHTPSHHRVTPSAGAVPGPARRTRARREPRHRRRSRPGRTTGRGLGAGHVRAPAATVGPAAGRGVRRAGRPRGGTGPAHPPGRTDRTTAGGGPGPHRRARRPVPRPAHPAVHHQGLRLQPARPQRRLDRNRPDRAARRDRDRRRPAGRPAGQPARTCPAWKPVWSPRSGDPSRWTRSCTGR